MKLELRSDIGGLPIISEAEKWNMLKIAEQRNTHLRTYCNKLGYGYSGNRTLNASTWMNKTSVLIPRLYYSDKLKVILCEVPKCGSTEWRKTLLIAEGIVNVTSWSEIEQYHIWKRLNSFVLLREKRYLWTRFPPQNPESNHEMNKRLNNYYRIMTVREPLERVVSAYINKIFPEGSVTEYYITLSEKIHAKFAKSKNTEYFQPGRASFEEFVDSILSNPKQVDVHWRLYSDICDPCHIQYDYIAKLETIALDSEYLGKKLGISNNLFFKEKSNSWESLGHKWKNKYRTYLDSLPAKKLHALYEAYWEQYKLFNYSTPSFV
uniref:carbohydrate sulfotransferase 9-like isoform X4 n=1 Tax=Styela clava TaxID=7725 RepID=UPI00193A150D|nr:carbohydrate sulfotransferase 9-like isoform X4 [Styela clava]